MAHLCGELWICVWALKPVSSCPQASSHPKGDLLGLTGKPCSKLMPSSETTLFGMEIAGSSWHHVQAGKKHYFGCQDNIHIYIYTSEPTLKFGRFKWRLHCRSLKIICFGTKIRCAIIIQICLYSDKNSSQPVRIKCHLTKLLQNCVQYLALVH